MGAKRLGMLITRSDRLPVDPMLQTTAAQVEDGRMHRRPLCQWRWSSTVGAPDGGPGPTGLGWLPWRTCVAQFLGSCTSGRFQLSCGLSDARLAWQIHRGHQLFCIRCDPGLAGVARESVFHPDPRLLAQLWYLNVQIHFASMRVTFMGASPARGSTLGLRQVARSKALCGWIDGGTAPSFSRFGGNFSARPRHRPRPFALRPRHSLPAMFFRDRGDQLTPVSRKLGGSPSRSAHCAPGSLG